MRGVEQVAAKSNVRAIVAEIAQHGRHNVGVLCNLPVVNATAQGGVAGSIEHNRHRELSEVGLIHIPARLAGVVGSNHKEGIIIPLLFRGGIEEALQCHVGVAHALVNRQFSFGKSAFVFCRNLIWGLRRSSVSRCHKRLLHAADFIAEELQERFVPDVAGSVEVGARIGVSACVFFNAVKFAETRCPGKRAQAHHTTGRAIEESRGVALVAQFSGNACHLVERSRGEKIWLFYHGDTRQHRRHHIGVATAVAEAVAESGATSHQRVEERRESAVAASVEVAVEYSRVFATEAFKDNHHHILRAETLAVHRAVHRRISGFHVGVGHKVGSI